MNLTWKNGPIIGILWAILRMWLGVQWLEAGLHKLTGGFDAGGFMKGAIASAGGEHPAVQGWYAAFLHSVALPNADVFSFKVAWGEVLVGLGLILGAATITALIAGAFKDMKFLLAGTTSINPILYTIAIILLFAGAGAYYYGVDRFGIRYIKDRDGKGIANKHAMVHL
ncbi:DoxX family membrane protein [Peribacillus saganii]|uniref:DoxX family membrane protein n=1 Tax=Peribacillus saganii TaxID=2303992 RepID=A0A372LM89_9BACI|nr:DoxX family membrane protein [Peribacillus saganii]RFU68149.1 DoxX family membrane protein [Peribacillus saganii]